jgi:DNA-binding MarR family transcriptional regulator
MPESVQVRLKEIPRYECLVEVARQYPDLDPSAMDAFLNLLYAGDQVRALMDEHLADHGISLGRFRILMLLFRDKPEGCGQVDSPAELAEQLGVSRATVTGLLDTLERDGFLRRTESVEDRRQTAVNLTPRGEAFLRRFLPGHFRLIGTIVAELTESERKTLVRLLGKIVAGVHAAHPAATPMT